MRQIIFFFVNEYTTIWTEVLQHDFFLMLHCLTRFEACRIVGLRASLLSQGACTMLTDDEMVASSVRPHDCVSVAIEELRLGRIKATVRRRDAHGTQHDVSVQSMILPVDL